MAEFGAVAKKFLITLPIATSLWIAISAPYMAAAQSSSAATSTAPSPQSLLNDIAERASVDAQSGEKMTVSSFRDLFGTDIENAGIRVNEAFKHYEKSYRFVKSSQPWWHSLKDYAPSIGWIACGIALVYAVFKQSIEDTIKKLVGWINKAVYRRIAGYRLFWRTGLKKYRKALVKKYRKVEVTFRPGRPLDMRDVYVPLKLKGGSVVDQIDARQFVADNKRIMVLGPPGSGKSMLTKRLALEYGETSMVALADRPIPIVLELNRLSESTRSIEDHLAEILELNDFPNAINFVNEHLNRGTLMLLLDGLDEVNSNQRAGVVHKIRDVLDKCEKCRAVITCRTAVYDDEFAASVDLTVEVVEFSDQQMQEFLQAWEKEFPSEKSVEQLLRTLQERPRIMEVARNPLMLTMIAFLYTDPRFVLPHSRAEFYKEAVSELIDLKSNLRLNEFKASHKRLVLQHLALSFQDRDDEKVEDKRSVSLHVVIELVSSVLPKLNLDSKDAQRFVDEIVTRSGLMLSIDGGLRYQFAHLTLQEFFAAEALSKEEELLARFVPRPNAWRETVKLWCGLDHDCTALIRGVFAKDQLTAFECLADAQQVEESLSSSIIQHFVARLGKNEEMRGLIVRAFGGVAADTRPRGEAVFNKLKQAISDPASELELVRDAAEALSFTNTSRAVEFLFTLRSAPDVRSALVRMGDIAVPNLAALAEKEETSAIDDLIAIGTPRATLMLAPLLWHKKFSISWKVAAGLATLTKGPPTERALRSFKTTSEQRNADWLKWIWKPFREPSESGLPIIMGRMAFLLSQPTGSENTLPQGVDPRILVPLILLGPQPASNLKLAHPVIDSTDEESKWASLLPRLIGLSKDGVTAENSVVQGWQKAWPALNAKDGLYLYERLSTAPASTRGDWERLFEPASYVFSTGWHRRAALTILRALSVLGVASVFISVYSGYPRTVYNNIAVVLAGCWLGLEAILKSDRTIAGFLTKSPAIIPYNDKQIEQAIRISDSLIYVQRVASILRYGLPWYATDNHSLFQLRFERRSFTLTTLVGIVSILLGGYFYIALARYTSWKFALGTCVIAAGSATILVYVGARKDRAARNPLHGILAKMSGEAPLGTPDRRPL